MLANLEMVAPGKNFRKKNCNPWEFFRYNIVSPREIFQLYDLQATIQATAKWRLVYHSALSTGLLSPHGGWVFLLCYGFVSCCPITSVTLHWNTSLLLSVGVGYLWSLSKLLRDVIHLNDPCCPLPSLRGIANWTRFKPLFRSNNGSQTHSIVVLYTACTKLA